MTNFSPPLATHSRHYRENRYVYPVLSRRSRGISLGINLNPDKVCNFDCIYCQVDRRSESETDFVALDRVLDELDDLLNRLLQGELFADAPFDQVPLPLRRLNDIAFSGDGEPTTYRNFDVIVRAVADLKKSRSLDDVKLVLISNAAMFHRPVVQRGLNILDLNQGEIWAKLDAGSEEFFKQVDRTSIPFSRILENIASAARIRPLVIQSLFMRIDDVPVSEIEIREYCDRLNEIQDAGGQVKLVQVYTVSRTPAESNVSPLASGELEAIAETIRSRTRLAAECFAS